MRGLSEACKVRVHKVLSARLYKPAATFMPHLHLQEDLGVGSIAALVLALEDEFNLPVSDEKLDGVQAVQDGYDLVHAQRVF